MGISFLPCLNKENIKRKNCNNYNNIHKGHKNFEINNKNESIDLSNKNNNKNILNHGLKNIGNSCYMNSFIQILLHCPLFIKCLEKEISSQNNYSLAKYLVKLSEEKDTEYIKRIREIMEFYYGDFKINQKCDSQNFGIKLIERIIRDIKGENDSTHSEKLDINKYIKEEISLEKLFVLIVEENKFYSTFKNQMFSLELNIQLSFSYNNNYKYKLEDLLAEKYDSIKIQKLPKILIITIERAILGKEYNKNQLEYPKELNMKKFSIKDKRIEYKYKIFAINKKNGEDRNDGHYFSYIKINNIWYLFDDLNVKEENPKNTFGDIVGLFYSQKN